MVLRLFFVFILFQFSLFANSSCEMWQDGSTNQQACMVADDRDKIQIDIKDFQKKIIVKFTNEHMINWVNGLNESQGEWEKYLKKQCELEEAVFGGIGSISQIRCERRLSEIRRDELRKML